MGEKIALGFHTCVDYELVWDTTIIENLIEMYDIQNSEITTDLEIDSERKLVLVCLGYMRAGTGGEMIPKSSLICEDFAAHFQYKVTIGGTAARAAIAIQKLKHESVIQMCCFNRYIKKLLPEGIHYFSGAGEEHQDVYPHVVLQYQANVRIQVNDIDFITPRENRVMFSHDPDSLNMKVSEAFVPLIQDAEVFLLSCFSEVLDFDILKDCIAKTKRLLEHLPDNALVIMEDGCYIKKRHRNYVHNELRPVLDILSMNEDELQELIGRRINKLDPAEVVEAVVNVYDKLGVPTILVHSSVWALAYGKHPVVIKNALAGGITMAATRFQWGDNFGSKEYEAAKLLPDRESSVAFCTGIMKLAGDKICCLPCKNLDFVANPTVVGLGDFFAGGLLPELKVECRGKDADN